MPGNNVSRKKSYRQETKKKKARKREKYLTAPSSLAFPGYRGFRAELITRVISFDPHVLSSELPSSLADGESETQRRLLTCR